MKSLNRKEIEDLIVDLYYNQKKTYREIQSIVRKSPRDIKVILNKVEPERASLSLHKPTGCFVKEKLQ
jgi:16S rRNA U516 pseudouridylate synthase RsuA-like enzyme